MGRRKKKSWLGVSAGDRQRTNKPMSDEKANRRLRKFVAKKLDIKPIRDSNTHSMRYPNAKPEQLEKLGIHTI